MDDAEFEMRLSECKETLERISREAKEISEKLCTLLEDHDGDADDVRWSCRTMASSVEDVLSDTARRLSRFKAGDKAELPSVLVLALQCCERLHDTADMVREGREHERRDLKGQIESNIGYLAHHINSMKEDGYYPGDAPEFPEYWNMVDRVMTQKAEIGELTSFICTYMDPVHEYLIKLRKEVFWEDD